MSCRFIDSGKRGAQENMALDAALLADLEHEQEPLLHFYDWEGDTATFGYFIDPALYLDLGKAKSLNLSLAKRPTGGGIVFHTSDLAFSFLLPATHPAFSLDPLENYAFVNKKVIAVIEKFVAHNPSLLPDEPTVFGKKCDKFCMAKPTKYDVMIGARKVGGAAQRKTRFGYLHQATIFLGSLKNEYLKELLLPEISHVADAMEASSHPLLPNNWKKSDLEEARSALRILLKQVFDDLKD